MVWLPATPVIGGNRVLPEKFLFGFAPLGLNEVAHDRDGLRVRCVMVAIRPIAGIENVVSPENLPQCIQPLLGKARPARLLDPRGNDFRKLDEDVLVFCQVPQQ